MRYEIKQVGHVYAIDGFNGSKFVRNYGVLNSLIEAQNRCQELENRRVK